MLHGLYYFSKSFSFLVINSHISNRYVFIKLKIGVQENQLTETTERFDCIDLNADEATNSSMVVILGAIGHGFTASAATFYGLYGSVEDTIDGLK